MEIRMMISDRTVSKNLAGGRIWMSAWVFLALLLITAGLYPSFAATSSLPEDFQTALDALKQEYGFPGATAAYVLRDGTTAVVATGLADVEAGTPMMVESRMLSASIGKTFVGATVVALAHEGALELDVPVARWLGDRQWFERLPNGDVMTLRHLLNHSSGLPDHVHLESFVNAVNQKWREKQHHEMTLRHLFNHRSDFSDHVHLESFANSVVHQWHKTQHLFLPEELIGFVLDMPALFEVGTSWSYTDTGYILIGLVIEEVTGRSYYEEIRERFLTPLDLLLTTPSDQRLLTGLAAGYMGAENSFGFPQKTLQADGSMIWHPGFEWTGGGLVSNSGDLARWGALLFEGHAMTGDYLTELLRGIPVSPEDSDIYYGSGVAIYRPGPFGPVYGHGGWIPGYSSSLRHYPDHGVTIAFQINTDIGIVDDTTAVICEMEKKLAEMVISSKEKGL